MSDPGGWPIPSSVRYHALALSLRVGGGTILPTRRRRGRSTPAPAALDRLLTDDELMEAMPTQTCSCDVHTGEAHAVCGDHGGEARSMR